MKWRCTWCGKPHAENDPPCDECGHGVFEEAVVRDDASAGTVDTGPQYVWRCANCGRDHVRNNPPCARCGNHDLEKTQQRYDDLDADLEAPGWLDVAKPYAPALIVLLVVALLFVTGIVPLSVVPGIGPPDPPEAPSGDVESAGIDLESTERAVYERLEAEREEPRVVDEDLADYATYQNRAIVALEYRGDRSGRVDPADFGVQCGGDFVADRIVVTPPLESIGDEDDLAAAVAEDVLDSFGDDATTGHDREGLDLHVTPDETISVVYAAC